MAGTIFVTVQEMSVGEAAGTAVARISRSGSTEGAVTITYGVSGNSATDGADFVGGIGTVVMPDGADEVSVPVSILNDALGESTEVLAFSIINADGGVLMAPRTTRISIVDDETPPPAPDPEPPLSSDYAVQQTTVVAGLNAPIRFQFSPVAPSTAYVAEKGGVIRVADVETGASSVFLDLRDQVNARSDRGLLDIALHPDFQNKPYLYAFYVVDPPETAGLAGDAARDGVGNRYAHVVRYTADAATGFKTVVPGSEVVLVGGAGRSLADVSGNGTLNFTDPAFAGEVASDRYINPAAATPPAVVDGIKQNYIKVDSLSHAGGALEFGPDGALYVSIGDGTSYNYADPRSPDVQNLDSLAGKILRIDPLTGLGLADNPFADEGVPLDGNRAKVFQLGLRNPFSMAFDAEGRLFITDTGWFTYEEINSGGPGANFGWPFFEGGDGGALLRTPSYRDQPGAAAFYAAVEAGDIAVTPAFRAFAHDSAAPGYQVQAITGGQAVYSGGAYPAEFLGRFFFTDVSEAEVYTVATDNRSDVKFLFRPDGPFAPTHYAQGADGRIYYADMATGKIGRLDIAPGPRHLYGTSAGEALNGDARDEVVTGLGGADTLAGAGGNDTLGGGAGNDVLDGGAGRDRLAGGAGADRFVLADAAHSRPGGDARDTVADFSAADGDRLDLSALDADATLAGKQEFRFLGLGTPDRLVGKGDAKFYHFGGNTYLVGNADDDGTADVQIELLGLHTLTAGQLAGAGAGSDLLVGASGPDALAGVAGDDTLSGGGGGDTLDGGAGTDRLEGGAGADRFVLADAAHSRPGATRDVIADFGAGDRIDLSALDADAALAGRQEFGFLGLGAPDRLVASGQVKFYHFGGNTYLVGNADGDGTADFQFEILGLHTISLADLLGVWGPEALTGGAGDDTLSGGGGDDTLDGGAGRDRLEGGTGADRFVFSDATHSRPGPEARDTIADFGAQDRLDLSALDADATLAGKQEFRFIGLGTPDRLVGAGDLKYYHINGNTYLVGGTDGDNQADVQIELLGLHTLAAGHFVGAGAGSDLLLGTDAPEALGGGGGADTLGGGAGDDSLEGGAGDDVLDGGAGRDRLAGGAGADRFALADAAHSRPGGDARDVVADFAAAEGDRIDLSALDADAALAGRQGFRFLGLGAPDRFVGAGELKHYQINGNTYLVGNADGDGLADFQIELLGLHTLTAGDLLGLA